MYRTVGCLTSGELLNCWKFPSSEAGYCTDSEYHHRIICNLIPWNPLPPWLQTWVQQGATINSLCWCRCRKSGASLLHRAVRRCEISVVEELLVKEVPAACVSTNQIKSSRRKSWVHERVLFLRKTIFADSVSLCSFQCKLLQKGNEARAASAATVKPCAGFHSCQRTWPRWANRFARCVPCQRVDVWLFHSLIPFVAWRIQPPFGNQSSIGYGICLIFFEISLNIS